ncbi:MAG: alpha/beta hydrolase [Paracoccaceae bacterium]|jgi:pimeloyl-ACP methyl ester carboxylesterase|nr:alpha/beta hydrolase [Paracoccaceae bacterium]MDP7184813.1 alpha/beta hydrolase [Paracoccaceae bacterium]
MPHFQSADGLNLFYTDEGDGLPVLALSGLTRNSRDFDFVAPHLEGVRLIRMDYRGRGKSEYARDFTTYSVPAEAGDAVQLLNHLGIDKAAILGTSRGGLIGMVLAATAKDRLLGVALNDVGPELDPRGIAGIMDFVGKPVAAKTLAEAARTRPSLMEGFKDVPDSRWYDEVARLYKETPDGLENLYDHRLRDALIAAAEQPAPDLWPVFDAMQGLPTACLRGAGSNLLMVSTFAEMTRRRPDIIAAEVPDRGHVPYLDEPAALDALNRWLELMR